MTTVEAPGCRSVPAAGRLVAVNGAAGAVVPVMVSGWVPVLTMFTPRALAAPVRTWPKSTSRPSGDPWMVTGNPLRSAPLAASSACRYQCGWVASGPSFTFDVRYTAPVAGLCPTPTGHPHTW
ncbi:hypothetical protein GTS_27480 [Gandjariella thermophila]|uniref:Uncharacterized protein n=1 Tax=Gandjariella thermophila TaxID=1931992 RepID=A0A4D4J367_9PSEU|nr:hypothetical protein GTS_27480 [Gandjariella thermophila]